MQFRPFGFLILLSLILPSCKVFQEKASRSASQEVQIATVNNNVCKRLTGNVVVYAVFVDSKYTLPWTEHDMQSTLDSMHKAMGWVEQQAVAQSVPLAIKVDYYKDHKGVVPIAMNFGRKTLSSTLLRPNGVNQVDRWADQIGFRALSAFGPDTSKTTRTKISPKDRERLIARLRDLHKTDNVALIYFLNNYYKEEISVALHTHSTELPEYAVVSGKTPGVIAHEFLHLFGALDLYITPFDNQKAAMRRKSWAMKEFPNEIMAFSYRSMDSLMVSPLTAYLIGWEAVLDERYHKMIVSGKVSPAKY